MDKKDETKFLKKIDNYSKIIINPKLLEEKWIRFCNSRKKIYLTKLFSHNILKKQLVKSKFFSRLLFNDKNIPLLLNLFRCESHRDVIIEILKNFINERNKI